MQHTVLFEHTTARHMQYNDLSDCSAGCKCKTFNFHNKVFKPQPEAVRFSEVGKTHTHTHTHPGKVVLLTVLDNRGQCPRLCAARENLD